MVSEFVANQMTGVSVSTLSSQFVGRRSLALRLRAVCLLWIVPLDPSALSARGMGVYVTGEPYDFSYAPGGARVDVAGALIAKSKAEWESLMQLISWGFLVSEVCRVRGP